MVSGCGSSAGEHGLSQAELAGKAGVSLTTLARLERRGRTSCRGRTLARLATALGEDPASTTLHPSPDKPGPSAPLSQFKILLANLTTRNRIPQNCPALSITHRQQFPNRIMLMSFDMTADHWHNLKDDPVVPGRRRVQVPGSGSLQDSLGVMRMAGQLHTPAEAAGVLKVRESWLKTKAAARLIPCTFIGKHLRFSDDDIAEITVRPGPASPSHRAAPGPAAEPCETGEHMADPGCHVRGTHPRQVMPGGLPGAQGRSW